MIEFIDDDGWVGELPPAQRLVTSQFEPVADQLRSRPGVWKIVATIEKKWYEPIRTGGLISQLQRAGCETASRTREDGKVNIYARFPTSPQDVGGDEALGTTPHPLDHDHHQGYTVTSDASVADES